MTVIHTSRSKLSLTNSKELNNAVMAACCTSCVGSSFRAPWMTAVRISFERRAKISGFLRKSQNPSDRRDRTKLTIDSQMYPIACRVATRSGVFACSFIKPSRVSMTSIHWPIGSSTAAMAATNCAATWPTREFVDARARKAWALIWFRVFASSWSQRVE